jgi:hypothetical protein
MASSAGLVFHFYNEEYLLPWFIEHHYDMFDQAIGIDYASTDQSRAILNAFAPDWKIIDSRNKEFDAVQVDIEAAEVENSLETEWKIILNVTEFLCWHNFKEDLSLSKEGVLGLRSYVMVDCPYPHGISFKGVMPYGYKDDGSFRHHRFLHRVPIKYYVGRHTTPDAFTPLTDQFIAWCGWGPWGEGMIKRKLQIQDRIPQGNKACGMGFQHIQTRESLLEQFEKEKAKSGLLTETDPVFAKYWNGRSRGCYDTCT